VCRKAGLLGVVIGCTGSLYLLYTGISSLASKTDGSNAVLVISYSILSLLLFLLSGYLIKKSNWKNALYCGAALTLFSILGMMSVGLFLLPGSVFILMPSAIYLLENKGGTMR
jgi:threonine/homoserine/homoserine lactone efflux protein